MSYSDFINTFVTPINSFFNWFSTLIDSFMSNYIFITILGLSLFVVVFSTIKSIIINYLSSSDNFDDVADKKRG